MSYGRRSTDLSRMKVSIGLTMMLLVAVVPALFFYPPRSNAQSTSPMDAPIITAVAASQAPQGVDPYAISATERNKDGLTIYLMNCDSGVCYGPTGNDIGEEAMVAKNLPLLPYALYISGSYRCSYVCWDAALHIVGASPVRYGTRSARLHP